MMLTFLVATAATQAASLRPGLSAVSFAKLRDLANAGHSDLSVLHEMAGVVNSIMLQEGNATDHLTASDQELLLRVIDMINNNMYASMNSAHNSDVSDVDDAIAAINRCSILWTARSADGGDLYAMHQTLIQYQNSLNDLEDRVDTRTLENSTAWSNLATHITLMSPAPECPAFPDPRTMPTLDVYFESSPYVTWWLQSKQAYLPVREAYRYANLQLKHALLAYAVGLAQRNTAYCDWKRELEFGCQEYETCYRLATEHYGLVVKPAVEVRMNARIEAYKAGETIIHQINFLLALEDDQATPSITTSRYEIAFPAVPAKQACDFSSLQDPMWVPTPVCDGAGPMPDFESRPQTHNLGNCGIYRDTLPGAALRGNSHTVVMALQFDDNAASSGTRQWIFNLGQETTAANHWLWSPGSSIQFGRWNGAQIHSPNQAPDQAQILATVYDGGGVYNHLVQGCVNGQNIVKHTGKTVEQCIEICDAMAECVAFEFGVAYGGSGAYHAGDCQPQRSTNHANCNGAHHNLDLYVKPTDGSYKLYVDGALVATKAIDLDIQTGNMQIGDKGGFSSESDIRGCVRGVDVYRRGLSSAEIADASTRLLESSCGFTAHHDGIPDGVVVSGAGSKKWNGCYDRDDAGRGGVYDHLVQGCVNGQNIVKHTGKTVEQCIEICDAMEECVAFEFGVAYGGSGAYHAGDCQPQRSTDHSNCNGAHHNLDLYVKKGGGNYKHRAHTGTIYQFEGTWRIAESGQYTSYQAATIRSSVVPTAGWVAGLDSRTPDGLGDAPAPDVRAVFT